MTIEGAARARVSHVPVLSALEYDRMWSYRFRLVNLNGKLHLRRPSGAAMADAPEAAFGLASSVLLLSEIEAKIRQRQET